MMAINSIHSSFSKKLFIIVFFLFVFLSFSSRAFAAPTQVYRSSAPNAITALAVGTSNALTISGSTATFATAPGDNVGVGDAIQYDTSNGSTINAIVFIISRTSSTVYTVASATSSIPVTAVSNNTSWSIYRAYSSLTNAESGAENTGIASAVRNFDTWSGGKDLTANDEVWNIALYANGQIAGTGGTAISGWTADATRYIRVYTPYASNQVGVSQRHAGKWDDNKYHIELAMSGNSQFVLRIGVAYTHIEGLQVKYTGSTWTTPIGIKENSITSPISFYIADNIVTSTDSTGTGIQASDAGNIAYITNNIVYKTDVGIQTAANTGSAYAAVYNNTVYNTSTSGFNIANTSAKSYLYNNLCYVTSGNCFVSNSYAGVSNNISSDATAPGTSSLTSKTLSEIGFLSTTTGSEDFHILTGSVAKSAGTDLSMDPRFPVTDDIDHESRPAGTFDVGADEYYDTLPPVISGQSPTGTLPLGTSTTTISVTTNENATCKYGTVSGTAYASIANTFSTTTGTTHTSIVSGLTNSTTFNYYVRCQDASSNSNTSDAVVTFQVDGTDIVNPTTPTNLSSSSILPTSATISWTASTDNIAVAGYKIFRCTGSSCTPTSLLATTSSATYLASNLTQSTTYRYAISAYDAALNESATTSPFSITTLTIPAPAFSDTFETGALTAPVGNYQWVPSAAGNVTVSNDIGYDGTHSLKLHYNGKEDCADSDAEQDFYLDNLPEVWIEYYIRIPDGTESADGHPFALRTQDMCDSDKQGVNNKFIRVWGGDLSHPKRGYDQDDPKWGASFDAADNGDGNLYLQWGDHDRVVNAGQPVESHYYPGISDSDPGAIHTGEWTKIQFHAKLASGELGGDGRVSLRVNDQLKVDMNNLSFYPINPPYFHTGYLMGWANTGYAEDTDIYIDNVSIYSSDPYWDSADSSAPQISDVAPSGSLTAGTTSVTLSLTTDESATCKYGTVAGTTYASIANTFSTTGDTLHSQSITGLSAGTYNYYVRCQDASSNTNLVDTQVSFTILDPSDSTPPSRTDGEPTGTLEAGTQGTIISLATDEASTCKYGTSANISYGSIANTFTTTGGTSHSATISGLSAGFYTYYVRCVDGNSNANTNDMPISFTVAADTTAPEVSITTPANLATVSGTSISITADANDDLGVDGVQFKLDNNTNIGTEDTSSPYSITWDTTAISNGSHTIVAVARDSAGNYATSTAINLTVDNSVPDTTAPSRFSGSPSGTLTAGTTNITLSLSTNETATCKYGTVASTAYASIANTFTTTAGTSHSQNISDLSAGTYNYYVRCVDSSLNANSNDFTITFTIAADASGPTVALTNPADLSIVNGASVTVSANASDDVSVSGVQFKLDGVNLGSEDTTSTYGITWDSTAATEGLHELLAVARDDSGNYATSTARTVIVDNSTPPVRTSGAPSGTLSVGTTGVTLSISTDESATCKYGMVSGTAYASIASTFTADTSTTHSASLTGLSTGTYTYYVRCRDAYLTANTDDYTITFTIAADSTGPVRTSGLPSGALAAGATTATLSLTTDEAATCKYSTSSGADYASIADTFSTTGGTSHSQGLTGLSSGSYTYYIRCSDSFSNDNTDDYVISFSIPALSIHSGGGGSRSSSSVSIPTNTASIPIVSVSTAVRSLIETNSPLFLLAQSLGIQLPPLILQVLNQTITSTVSSSAFTRDLSLNSTGEDVRSLQNFLVNKNFGPAASALKANGTTTFFGPLTQAALIEYQKAMGITPAIGYFGPVTKGSLR